MKVLISACLLGQYCRYDGKVKKYEQIKKLLGRKDIQLIPVCPEQLGGLPTPREPSERRGSQVITKTGRDVTKEYQRGAAGALYYARLFHCELAVLKEKSPSCGSGRIYDGTFSRTLTDGEGVTAEVLRQAGLKIIGESDLASF